MAGTPTPPPGGFQQGGWYNGQQYWNGTFSAPGVINSQSNQQGAGQAVSAEVNRQTSVAAGKAPDANQNYVNKQIANPVNPVNPNATDLAGSNGATGGVGTGSGMPSMTAPAPFDLVGTTNAAYNTPELTAANQSIVDINNKINSRQQALADAQAGINDNPFYSEATRVGKSQKLTEQANNDISVLQKQAQDAHDQVTQLRADAEIKINAAKGQYDINNQAAQQAFQQFTTLLQAGALDNASGDDIAAITRSTGISSAMIASAVNAQQKKDIKTSMIQFDDGTNQGYAVVNADTGEIINKQILGPSKPSGSGTLNDTRSIDLENKQAPSVLLQGAKLGKTLPDMVAYGAAHGVSAQDVYNIYSGINYYNATTAQQKSDKKKYGIK